MPLNTVEPRYNHDLGTREITLSCRWLRTRRALTLFNHVLLRTRRELWAKMLYRDCTLLVLNKTSFNNCNALLALNWRYQVFCYIKLKKYKELGPVKLPCYKSFIISDPFITRFHTSTVFILLRFLFTAQSHSIVLVDLNEFSSSFYKCIILTLDIRKQVTTSNFLRITLKGSLRVSNERSLEGAMYINLW